MAATRGAIEELLALLEGGANVDTRGEKGHTALFNAVLQRNFEAARVLLEHGATKDVANDWGETPLQYAKSSGLAELIGLLENPPRGE